MSAKILLLPLLSLIALCALLGCGGDDPTTPGEEVVSDKWKEPKDIGKVYTVDKPKLGDTVFLSTGEEYTIGKFDHVAKREEGFFITTYVSDPHPDEPNRFIVREKIERGFVVPEGAPIVRIFSPFWNEDIREPEDRQITKKNNIQEDSLTPSFDISIDRVVDYNLPIYIEYQLQQREAFGGEVTRRRFLVVVVQGNTYTSGWLNFQRGVGNKRNEYMRASISVLPYTEMNKIELPAKIGANLDYFDEIGLPIRDKTIPEGHKFRPYRIASSSFFMAINTPDPSLDEQNRW